MVLQQHIKKYLNHTVIVRVDVWGGKVLYELCLERQGGHRQRGLNCKARKYDAFNKLKKLTD